jgi:hypothetical protein
MYGESALAGTSSVSFPAESPSGKIGLARVTESTIQQMKQIFFMVFYLSIFTPEKSGSITCQSVFIFLLLVFLLLSLLTTR